MTSWMEKVVDVTGYIRDAGSLRASLEIVTNDSGFDGFAYYFSHQNRDITISNYHHEWQSRYIERRLVRSDPVVRRAKLLRRAFSWDAEEDRSLWNRDERLLFKEAAEFDIRSGITVPVKTANGGTSLFTLVSKSPRSPENRIVDEVAAAASVGQLHATIACIDMQPSNEEGVRLDPKAAIYLRWIEHGLSWSRVASIEGTTYDSVRSSLVSAKKKLDCATTTQLVATAIRRHLI
ncbi:autoinducer-binding transcriptional regulator TraR [Brucella cytisi]|uniref:autoinducer-binding transcriptional regulator TraR n=1 Tax=Brucella cytisi TaxID=407152 RepID=UPI0035E371D3